MEELYLPNPFPDLDPQISHCHASCQIKANESKINGHNKINGQLDTQKNKKKTWPTGKKYILAECDGMTKYQTLNETKPAMTS